MGIENNIKALIINNFDKRINLAKDLQDYYLSEAEFKDILIEVPIPGSVAMKDTSINHLKIFISVKIISKKFFTTSSADKMHFCFD